MSFKLENYSSPKTYTKNIPNNKYSSFLGVDYANTALNVNDARAVEMSNFIHKDGVNHKRNGYDMKLQITKLIDNEYKNLSINGFWSFIDSFNHIEHIIVHAGTKIFEVKIAEDSLNSEYKDITESATVLPYYWTDSVESKIKNTPSWGIARGNRLYILCGIYLVYGTWNNGETWELRPVQDGVDTYIPTTTIGIGAIGVESTQGAQTILDEVNLLSRRRKNKLIGISAENEGLITLNEKDYPLSSGWFEAKTAYEPASYNFGYFINQKEVKNAKCLQITLINNTRNIKATSSFDINTEGMMLGGSNSESWNLFEDRFYNGFDGSNIGFYLEACDIKIEYTEDHQLSLLLAFGTKENEEIIVEAKIILGDFKYQLESNSIKADSLVVYLDDGRKLISEEDYSFDADYGIITMLKNYPALVPGTSNIIVEFEPYYSDEENQSKADKINLCKFGILFGYGGLEQLFVAGNENCPNIDYHSSIRDNSEINYAHEFIEYEDLTYFSDLCYTSLGSQTHKITGYSLLSDNVLGIHKEFNPNEPSLYLRTSYLNDAIDSGGNVVQGLNGQTYSQVYYSITQSAIGEGNLTHRAVGNLAGDRLILSKNGVFGIALTSNVSSNERYARERGRLINPKLLKSNLDNACAIVFENRYYLAIENVVYVADSRFSNKMNAEMDDTFCYEWWKWDLKDNVRCWFIHNNRLGFGTENGEVCFFDDSFSDKTYYSLNSLTYLDEVNFNNNLRNSNFVFNSKDADKIIPGNKIKFFGRVLEKVGYLVSTSDEEVFTTIDYYFENKLIYCDRQEVEIEDVDGIYILELQIDSDGLYENNTFKLKNKDTGIYLKLKSNAISSNAISKLLEEEQTIGRVFESDNGELCFNLLDYTDEVENENNTYREIYYVSPDCKCKISYNKPVYSKWFTPIFDLGTSEYSKIMNSFTIVLDAIENGKVNLEIRTKNLINSFFEIAEGTQIYNLENSAFTSWSFQTSYFAKSFTKVLKLKNFNFIQFIIHSDNDKDCVINGMSLSYKFGRKNRGVN